MVRARGKVVATALAVVVSVFVSTIGVPDGLVTAASAAELPEPMKESPVTGTPVPITPEAKGAEDLQVVPSPVKPVWPKPGVTEVAVTGKRAAAELPVRIGPPEVLKSARGGRPVTKKGTAPQKVRIQTYDHTVADRIGGYGLALRLTRTDGGTIKAPVTVTVDYSAFRGPNANRLALIRQPACVLDSPLTDTCRAKVAKERAQLPVVNDVKTGTLTAVADADATGAEVLMVASTASATNGSSGGSFEVTDLKPSGTWQVGLSGGAFSYSYPIVVPPPLSGEGPKLALEYSSTTVDGLSSQTNNQSSVVGTGWDLAVGFIEQAFSPCDDRCWQSGSETEPGNTSLVDLTLSLGGRSSKIVKDTDSGQWKTVEDYGWKIEKVAAGAPSGQPYWRITAQDGTNYRLGYRRDASLQTPFFGDDSGEPCHDIYVPLGQETDQVCVAPYRWMLDQEVDAKGNVIDYNYQRDTAAYCSLRMYFDNCLQEYDRGAFLSSVTYGSNTNVAGSAATARVLLEASPREFDGATDEPTDLDCGPIPLCGGTGPTFYLDDRLSSITTQVATGSGWADVMRYDLTHRWIYSPGGYYSEHPILWLDKVQQTGKAGNAPEVSLPAVKFASVLLDNRVNYSILDSNRSQFPRISAVTNEMGGRIEVTYGQPSGCDLWTETPKSVRDDEGQDCYWSYESSYTDEAGGFHELGGVWNKWMVTKIVEKDLVAGSPDLVTSYQYVGQPAWTLATLDTSVGGPFGDSWTRFRGYPTVRTVKGTGTDPAGYSVTSSTFFRGMYEDRTANNTPRHTQITDFEGNSFPDRDLLAGKPLMEQTLRALTMNGSIPATFQEEEGARYEYQIVTTGNGTGSDDPSFVNQTRQVGRERISSGWRYTEKATTYNPDALPIRVNDYGERGVASDNTCTATTYARNTASGAWMISYPASEERRKGDDCASGTFMGRTVTLYDGATGEGANLPTKGNATETRAYTSATDFTATKVTYDGYGRSTSSTDPLNKTTTTTYTPSAGWPTGGVAVTNPLGHTTTTWANPEFGQPVGMRNEAGYDTNIDYDPLGRTIALWTPAQPKSGGTAAATVTYTIPVDGSGTVNGPARTAVSKLQTADTYVTTYTYDDGLGRTRETQVASPAGGRVVSATVYDSRGLTSASSGPAHNAAEPGSGLLNAAMTTLPQWRKQTFDGVGRVVASADMTGSSEMRRTTTDYFGDRTEVIPPVGGKTVRYTDAEDKVTKIEEWLTGAGTAPAALQGPAAAKASSGRTLLADRTTEDSQTYRNSDGSFTTEFSSGPVRVRQPNGGWAGIDTTLIEAGGVLKPKVAAATVEFSLGGKGTLARLEGSAGERFALEWPADLPRPQVKGNVATYVDAGGGVGSGADLVVTALSSGFRPDVVLRKPPSGPVEYRLPVVAQGMTLARSREGGLALTDGAGRTVASAPAPIMWDASGKRGRTGKIETEVVNEGGRQVLVLRPDPVFLADEATRYPVTVDPTTTLPVLTDTWIADVGGTGADSQSAPELVAGSYALAPFLRITERAYLTFNTASLAGATVSAAALSLSRAGATGCGDAGSGIRAQRVTGSWTMGGLTWSSQPAVTTAGQVTANDSATCGAPGAMTWNVLPFAQAWASGTANNGIMLRGVDEVQSGRPAYERVFHSNETTSGAQYKPSLSVTYTVGSAPSVASPAVLPFTTVSGQVTATSLTPQLSATLADSAGGPLTGEFEVEHDPSVPAQGSGQIWAGSVTGVATGGVAALTVAPGEIEAGWLVRWRARAVNPGQSTSSAWTAWQSLRVNPAAAPAPVISPLAHWKLDEGSGTAAADTSGNGFGATLQAAAGWAPGLLGQSMSTAGASAAASGPVLHTNQGFTVSAWVRPSRLDRDMAVISQDGNVNSAFKIAFGPGDQKWRLLSFASDTSGSGTDRALSSQVAKVNTWTHLTGVYDASLGRLRLYVDGVLSGELTFPISWDARGATQIGRAKGNGSLVDAWHGQIDDVRAYQKVLTAAEITALAAGSPAPDRTPTADQTQVTPSSTANGVTTVTSLTPTLSARVAEPGGQALRAEFQVEHDGQQVWTGSRDNVTAGTNATAQIPAGELEDSWEVRWRARAVRGDTASAWSSWQTFTVDMPKPSVSALQLTPSTVVEGQTVTSTVTPQLTATVTDPGGAALRAEFEVEQPNGTSAWTGNVPTVASGGQAQITVPSGELIDGVPARWRVRAVNPNGNIASAWSPWQDFTVDTPDPSIGSLQTDPSVVSGTETLTPTLTPNLRATVSEPGNGQVKAEFEIEHDGQQIWTGPSAAVASGQVASVGVPSGELTDGWTIRWRARAVTVATSAASAWSEWQTVRVQLGPIDPDPAVGALEITRRRSSKGYGSRPASRPP
ncbi:LamG-like jellyroll fold domain-containing protein [Acrocarpospora sp. B8E8]|uniref:LamG-like jellyroll fold domain-containing protein n=1 Tax=Acrocarpospora sp. B8E8 TaxID=3153572 RepID=UPI00325E4BFE